MPRVMGHGIFSRCVGNTFFWCRLESSALCTPISNRARWVLLLQCTGTRPFISGQNRVDEDMICSNEGERSCGNSLMVCRIWKGCSSLQGVLVPMC